MSGYLEIVAVATGFVCVWLYVRQVVWSWPATILSAALFFLVFYEARLYANMGLQLMFIGVAVYGWNQWLRGGETGTGVVVHKVTRAHAILLGTVTAIASAVLFFVLRSATDASQPLWDSIATALSLTGQWMLARKILENWLVWIVADLIFIGTYVEAELYPTAALYAAFLVLAVMGYFSWRRTLAHGRPIASV